MSRDAERVRTLREGGRRSLTELAAEELRRLIVEGRLAPGTRLGEHAFARRLGVSRTPLREALKLLAREGLVVLERHRGARVAPLDLGELVRTVEVLRHLELLVGELAAARAAPGELRALHALHHDLEGAWLRGDLEAYFAANQAFHLGLVRATGNPVLFDSYARLNDRIRRHRLFANLAPGRWRQAVEEHRRILELLLARDGPALGRALAEHLDHKLAALRGAEERAGESSAPADGTPGS